MFWIGLLIGLLIGSVFGVLLLAIAKMGKEDEDDV